MGKKKGSTRAEILEMQYTQPKMVKVYGITGKPKMVVEELSQRDRQLLEASRASADITG